MTKRGKQWLTVAASALLCLALAPAVDAMGPGFYDADASMWYADSVFSADALPLDAAQTSVVVTQNEGSSGTVNTYALSGCYTVTIPAELRIDPDSKSGKMTVQADLDAYTEIEVQVDSVNDYVLKNADDEQKYNLTGYGLVSNTLTYSTVESKKSELLTTDLTAMLDVGNAAPKYAGEYSDTLNFTIELTKRKYTFHLMYEDIYGNFTDTADALYTKDDDGANSNEDENVYAALEPDTTEPWTRPRPDSEKYKWQVTTCALEQGRYVYTVKVYRQWHYLDVNGTVYDKNGKYIYGMGNTTGLGLVEVYLNDSPTPEVTSRGTQVDDYWAVHRYGTKYTIKFYSGSDGQKYTAKNSEGVILAEEAVYKYNGMEITNDTRTTGESITGVLTGKSANNSENPDTVSKYPRKDSIVVKFKAVESSTETETTTDQTTDPTDPSDEEPEEETDTSAAVDDYQSADEFFATFDPDEDLDHVY